jgi:hypothetical protein
MEASISCRTAKMVKTVLEKTLAKLSGTGAADLGCTTMNTSGRELPVAKPYKLGCFLMAKNSFAIFEMGRLL